MQEEIEEGFTCEKCGATYDSEEAYQFHMEDHDSGVLAIEVLSAEDQGTLITGLEIAVATEELQLKKKYGYKIPKSKEKLSKVDFDAREKELLIRQAMSKYVKIAQGEEPWDGKSLVIAPVEEFDPKDYNTGVNILRIRHFTPEHEEQVKKELGEDTPTPEIATKVIRGEFDEPVPEVKPVTQTVEELSKDPYEDLTERLLDQYESLWAREGKVQYSNLDEALQESALLNIGKEIFRYAKCPIENCAFSVPKKLSKKEKYIQLVKHYMEDHLQKVKGKTSLTAVKRFIATPEEDAIVAARKEFTHPREEGDEESAPGKLMPHQTGAPNPEQCSASFEQLTKDKLPKDDSLPSVDQRRGLFSGLREVTDRGTKDLSRAFSGIAPTPEELEELKEIYKPYYYDEKKFVLCKVCKARLGDFRRFLIHMRTEHSRQYKEPLRYKEYYQ